MSRPAIAVEDLSKLYRIGEEARRFPTFREALIDTLGAPLRRFRQLGSDGSSESSKGSFWALRHVGFDVGQGEVVGIIGRNGAGKSTLLKILSRITEPTEGQIRIRGRVASLLEVGTGFHPELTGRENVYLNGSILGMKGAEIARKFDEIVAFAEIEKFLDTPVKYYSSGMYVRLAFAVAAHLEPEILIVDEVLAVGDVDFQKKCLGKMKEVSVGGGRTVLFVSHNLTAVRALCDRAVWLSGGQVLRDGPVGPVVESYLSSSLEGSEGDYLLGGYDRQQNFGANVRLRRLVFNGGTPIRHGQPLRVEIAYDARSDADGIAFGLGFCSHDGVRVMTVDTDAPGERYLVRGGTSGSVEMTIPEVYLQPGRYMLDIAARSGENLSLDFLQGFATVEVLPGPDTPPHLIGRAESGSVRIPVAARHFPATEGLPVGVS